MLLNWYGHSCFLLKGKSQGNADIKDAGVTAGISILIDPFDKKIGLTPPKIKPDLLLITHHHYDHNNNQLAGHETVVLDGPGEYEIKGVIIKGVHSWHDEKEGAERGSNTIYSIILDGLRIVHLGDFGEHELSSPELKEIGEVDILFVPVGGVYTVDAEKAAHILHQIEPRVVIPMHYHLPELSIKLGSVDEFVKISGLEAIKESKLNIKQKDLPQAGDTKLYVLKAGG